MRWNVSDELVQLGLKEDLAQGDVTTDAVVDPRAHGEGTMVAREQLVVSGLGVAEAVFQLVDDTLDVERVVDDGTIVEPGATLLRIRGRFCSLLGAERLALNLLCHLSGIATHTRRFVNEIEGLPVRLVDTRKTTPGMRALEKAAVRHGGGHNHRFSLADGILIKDNHVLACGGVRSALERAKARRPHHLLRIEIEVDRLEQLEEALSVGVDAVLLDNMSVGDLRRAVAINGGRALLEASGGVRLETVREIAETGVDLISAGSLVHGARWVDIGLDFILHRSEASTVRG